MMSFNLPTDSILSHNEDKILFRRNEHSWAVDVGKDKPWDEYFCNMDYTKNVSLVKCMRDVMCKTYTPLHDSKL